MSKATTSGMGKGGLLLRLILSILLVFSLLGTVGSAVGVSVLCGPSQLISQMHRHDAGQKVYDSLNTKFQNDYNTTAVPAEVYMDTISVDWLEQCMENKVTALYGKDSGDIDFSALESSITDYFEKYAEENNCAKDDTYNEKLRETIDNGEKIISDATDLLRTETLQKSGYLSKLRRADGTAAVAAAEPLLDRHRLFRRRRIADCRGRGDLRHRRDPSVRTERGGCLRRRHRHDDGTHHGGAGLRHRPAGTGRGAAGTASERTALGESGIKANPDKSRQIQTETAARQEMLCGYTIYIGISACRRPVKA